MLGKTVAVTGANGFVASWLVKLLLERGYHVRGTVRDPDNVAKVGHLLELPGAEERLTLFKAHLLDDEALEKVFDGVDCVFHTASPVTLEQVPDVERDLLIPAVKGTITVLSSAAKANTVKKVVFTSSNAAVSYSESPFAAEGEGVVVDESWWSDEEWCRKTQSWYALSKTQAEKAAWEYVKDKDFDLVVLNPTLVLGPFLQKSLNASSEMILQYLQGSTMAYPNRIMGLVHVKDVAMAHVLAYENPSAEGRYFLAEKTMQPFELIKLLKVLCPSCPIVERSVDNTQYFATTFRTDKIKKLGLEYTPGEEAIKDCIASLREHNFL